MQAGGGTRTPLSIVGHDDDLRHRPSKTGTRNINIMLDLQRQKTLAVVLEAIVERFPAGARLWHCTYEQLRVKFMAACHRLGLEALQPCIHCLRHGGASHDYMVGARTILGIQCRGAWKATSSVRRYEKAVAIGKQLQRLPTTSLHFITDLSDQCDSCSGKIFAPLNAKPVTQTGKPVLVIFGAAAHIGKEVKSKGFEVLDIDKKRGAHHGLQCVEVLNVLCGCINRDIFRGVLAAPPMHTLSAARQGLAGMWSSREAQVRNAAVWARDASR